MKVADLSALVRAMCEYSGVAVLAENHSQSAYPTFVIHGDWQDPVQFVYIKAHTPPTKAQTQQIARLEASGCVVSVWNVDTDVNTIIEHIQSGGKRGENPAASSS